MESTGSYWQTLFNALQQAGFEVLLVGGSQTKNVKGRKTDVIDCIWIQKLHSLGLLSGSLLLSDTFQQLRTYYYHRLHLVEQSARYSSKMQKCLRLMNIRLDVVLNDITGQSGMAVIEAILAGQREPEHLASLISSRVKKSRQRLVMPCRAGGERNCCLNCRLVWTFTDSTKTKSKRVIRSSKRFWLSTLPRPKYRLNGF
jgi:hypothetical protein